MLGGAAVLLVVAVLAWRARAGAGAQPTAQPTQPGLSGFAMSTDQQSLATNEIQQELSALTTEVSSGFAASQAKGPCPAGSQVVPHLVGVFGVSGQPSGMVRAGSTCSLSWAPAAFTTGGGA